MNIFPLIFTTIFAASKIITPLPDDTLVIYTNTKLPTVSFGAISNKTKDSNKLSHESIQNPIEKNRQTVKKNITIALLGDSMIDTLGSDLTFLKNDLALIYPNTKFTFYNYGVGATNISYGLERLTHDYVYLGNQVPALISRQPDIVVVESFAYNPLSDDQSSYDEYWLTLAHIVTLLKSSLPSTKIIIAATIAPNSRVFGDGAPAISFDSQDKVNRTNVIKKYLENAIAFARSQKLPLADVYHSSLDGSGNGTLNLINPGDHIHYSDAGRKLFSEKVARTIVDYRLLE
jgi:hypothetical protein